MIKLIQLKKERPCVVCQVKWNSFPLYESTEILICSSQCREVYELNPLGYEDKRRYIVEAFYSMRDYPQYKRLTTYTDDEGIIHRVPLWDDTFDRSVPYNSPVMYREYAVAPKNKGMVLA